MARRIDWLPALVFSIFGALFFREAFQITTFGQGSGGKIVPIGASGLVLLLGLAQLFLVLAGRNRDTTEHISAREFLVHSGPIILLMGAYGYFHGWFGYLVATLICAVIAFRLFENSWRQTLVHSVIGALVLYFVFIRTLGVYDPAGSVIDISGLF